MVETVSNYVKVNIMEQHKKKTGENWSSEEKEILRQLIAQSAQIIEDRSTKTNINLMKAKEWKNILVKFNNITGKCRTEGEVKLAWKRMKLSAKANLSAHKRELTKTGGGEKPPSPSAEDLEVMAIAPHDFIIEVNDYDSDAVIPATITSDLFVDPQPGPSCEIVNNKNTEHIFTDVQVTEVSNSPTINTENANIVLSDNVTRNPIKKRKTLHKKNSTEEMRKSIVDSNYQFKQKQLQMMEIEHKYNIKIAELKIKKLELEIALLQSKENINTN